MSEYWYGVGDGAAVVMAVTGAVMVFFGVVQWRRELRAEAAERCQRISG